jgi:GntR family transcriptional regulator / MocR family aminotransferase
MSGLSPTVHSLTSELRLAPFRTGMPAMDTTSLEVWGRLLARRCRNATREILVHGDPAGLWRLRVQIAQYVGAARGVLCDPQQVVIVSGSQQGIDLVARVLLDPGDAAVVEDPGYLGGRFALRAAGIEIVPKRVGREGLCVEKLPKKAKRIKLVYVTPSHQFPLGMVLSLTKRLQLLAWAACNNTWILEDDFDSEFRYESRPISALQGLDEHGRVIYVGTFSKILFPSIRLGYLIVPKNLVSAFVAARSLCDRSSPIIEQAALADFISEGHFASHIRRTRTYYLERRNLMINLLRQELDGVVEVPDIEAGMHMVAWLPRGVDDSCVSREAAKRRIYAVPVSVYAIRPLGRGGLMLGYAAFSKAAIRKGIQELAAVIKSCIN